MRIVAVLLVMTMAGAPPDDGLGGNSDNPPPVSVALGRSVSTRNASGGLQRLTAIPATSAFAKHGGGSSTKCTVTADRDDFVVSNGDTVPKGTVVTSDYLFVEGLATNLDLIPKVLPPDILEVPSRGPLEAGMRTFSVFCDRSFYDINFRGLIQCPSSTRCSIRAASWPTSSTRCSCNDQSSTRTRWSTLRRPGHALPHLARHRADAWRVQQSPSRYYRGAELRLIARPRDLEFVVDFVPNPDKPSPAFRGVVSCVPSIAATADDVALPSVPNCPSRPNPA